MSTSKNRSLKNFLIENFYKNTGKIEIREQYIDDFVIINIVPPQWSCNNFLLTLIRIYSDLR